MKHSSQLRETTSSYLGRARRFCLGWILLWLLLDQPGGQQDAHGQQAGSTAQQGLDFFEKKVRPLLVQHCYQCHGPDSDQGEGRLRLDKRTAILRGGKSGPAVIPGKPEQSLLIHAVNHDPAVESMPPDRRLKNEEVATLIRWVKMKAPWPGADLATELKRPQATETVLTDQDRAFWSFVPPAEPLIPKVRQRTWVVNPIDALVLARLEQARLQPAPQADRETLIRRATFDLHGLPPTPQEVSAFLQDMSPDAFKKLVERLLDSPRYGEKWGRHWMDVARYSDSNGMDDNIAYTEAWRYRDYVIAAFNRDKPYDQFVREQIAGDLLSDWEAPGRAESVVATTFLMLGPKMPSADDPIKQQLDIVDEQLDTMSRAFLAMTIGCARCHAHKFDPFSSRDYYALAGIFKSTRSMLGYRVDSKFNLTALTTESENRRLSELEQQMDAADDILVNGNKVDMSADQKKQHTAQLNGAYDKMEKIPTAMAVEEGIIADMPVLLRGNHLTPARSVARGVPRILPVSRPFRVTAGESGRRDLANWLTDPGNPLTGRVMVNRIWHWHMGAGIVRSVDNFGRLGERPDNQPLLDWLALRFVESGWSVKQMHRLIMNSSTYQMSSRPNARASKADPENRLLWRMNPRRLEAEELRDSLLMLSQQLDLTMGGRMLPVRNHKIMSGKEIADCNAVHKQPRRTVYLPVIRSGLHEFLTTFDFSDPSVPAGRRNLTTVAPQALFMMNSALVTESCQRIARIVLKHPAISHQDRVRYVYQLILSRQPTDQEVDLWVRFIQQRTELAITSKISETERPLEIWSSVVRVLLSSNEFVYLK